jgi:VanZ family protein
MTTSPAGSPAPFPRIWSNRILIAAVAVILFLTLYPLRFAFSAPSLNTSPFLLGTENKPGKPLDVVLNILLFIPFGFGLCAKLRDRGASARAAVLLSWLAGALLSYSIELAQFYMPARDSGWEDVLTNSTGALFGACLVLLAGSWVQRHLAAREAALETRLSPGPAVLVLLLYFILWLGASVHFQKQARLKNWDPASFLIIGNDAKGQSPWKGRVSQLQIWDRALTETDAKAIAAGNTTVTKANVAARFSFLSLPPYQDQSNLLPPLNWTSAQPTSPASGPAVFESSSWLTTNAPVGPLVAAVQKTSQFSVCVTLETPDTTHATGRIISISRPLALADLSLQQDRADLVFAFHTPLSAKRAFLPWRVPGVLIPNRLQTFLFSYDGSDLSIFADGRPVPQSRDYQLTPGAGLVHLFLRIRTPDLEGYRYGYYACVFLPLGALLGIAARGKVQTKPSRVVVLAAFALISAVALELALMRVTARSLSPGNVVLSLVLLLAGSLWVNADSPRPEATST